MREYYDEYIYAKFVLCKLVCQFYDHRLTKEEADKLSIEYSDEDIFNSLDYISCIYHRYSPEGLYLWYILKIDKPIITLRQMWNITRLLGNEEFDENKDYHNELIKIKLIDLYLIEEYYKRYINKEEADVFKIEYDFDLDEEDGKIEGYDHLYESAGEHAWNLFGFEESFVPYSKVLKIENQLQEALLYKDKN